MRAGYLVGRTIVAVYEQSDEAALLLDEAALLLDNDDIVRFRAKELLYRIDVPAMGNPDAADKLRANIGPHARLTPESTIVNLALHPSKPLRVRPRLRLGRWLLRRAGYTIYGSDGKVERG